MEVATGTNGTRDNRTESNNAAISWRGQQSKWSTVKCGRKFLYCHLRVSWSVGWAD